MKHSRIGALLIGAALVVLAGCPNLITDIAVSQVSDKANPLVSFSSPPEGSAYTQTVTVQGTVLDAGRLKGLTWIVTGPLGTLASGTLDPAALGANGAFSFQFSTLEFSGPIAVTVQATDWNDNVGQGVRTFISSGTALSSFVAAPHSGKVTLSWEPVAGAAYTLYYTTNGSLPAQGYGLTQAIGAPPYDLTGLANGAMHVFLLRAAASGKDYWSGYVSSIPLSGATLAPSVRSTYGAVSVEWKSIPGSDQFQVLRSTNRLSGFSNISGTITGTRFTDTVVLPGVRYFYQIRPALAGSVSSAPVAGELSPLPLDSERRVGYVIPPGNQLTDVAVFGSYAFAANYNNGFQVFDVSNPAHPVYVNGVSLSPDHAMGIGLNAAGTVAYVSAGTYVYSIDISTPAFPQYLAKSVSVGAQTWGVTVRGSDVFVAAGTAGAVKFANGDLTGVSATFSTTGQGGGGAYGIASDANYVYIAAESRVFVASPGPFTTSLGSMSATRAMGVAVATQGSTTFAYVADETASTLRIFDVTNPGGIITQGTLALSGNSPRGVSVRWPTVALAGSIAAGSAALQVANVADPVTPRLAFPVMLPSGAERVAIAGDFAFVAMQGLGLQVANIANAASPTAQPSPPVLSSAYALAVDGDIGVATSIFGTLQVYDLSSPSSPQPLGPAYSTLGTPYGVAVKWPYAYVAEPSKLEIVDLSPAIQSQAPVRAGWTTIIGFGNDIALSGDYAVVADSGNCVDIVNVADAANPVTVGNFLTTGSVQGVGARGNYVYAVTLGPPATFYVVSLANPLQPQAVGSLSLSGVTGQINSLTVAGDFVYLSASSGGTGHGMAIIDISNPAAPSLRNAVSLGFDGRCVEVVSDIAFVGPLSGTTFRIFSISSPSVPRLIGTINQGAVGIKASGNHAFVADYFGGHFTSLSLWQ